MENKINIDYKSFLSVDNGKGLLLHQNEIEILYKYGFDYKKYTDLKSLIFDIDNYINSYYIDTNDLEEVLINLSEINYYNNIKK